MAWSPLFVTRGGPFLGGIGKYPWPLPNHHKKSWDFLSFWARGSFLDFLGPTLSPNWPNSSHSDFWFLCVFLIGFTSRFSRKKKKIYILGHFGEMDHSNFALFRHIGWPCSGYISVVLLYIPNYKFMKPWKMMLSVLVFTERQAEKRRFYSWAII